MISYLMDPLFKIDLYLRWTLNLTPTCISGDYIWVKVLCIFALRDFLFHLSLFIYSPLTITCWQANFIYTELTLKQFYYCSKILKNNSHENMIYSALIWARNLIPIHVGQTCPGVSFMCTSLFPHTTCSTIKTAPKLVDFCVCKSYFKNVVNSGTTSLCGQLLN